MGISAMSIPFSGRFSRSAGIYSAIGKQLNSVNLKPVQKIVFKFDPFQQNVTTVRDCLFMFSSEKISNTNLRCLIKTDIVDNAEPSISVTLGEGKNFVFKTSNLNSLEVLQEFNKIVLPLVPKEEEVSERKYQGRDPGSMKMIENMYSQVPAFTDIFDEETFYIFVVFFVIGTLIVAYIGSRVITIKPVE